MAESNASSFPGDRWEPELGIIFSSRDGFVWASWPETDASVRLGRQEVVSMMMRDFLAQNALGERLSSRPNQK
jgi:hypothetical protein